MSDLPKICALIPAFKKNVAFPDDIVRPLAGRPLIAYAIDACVTWLGADHVILVTDSEEVEAFGERNGVRVIRHRLLNLDDLASLSVLKWMMRPILRDYEQALVLWPYTPAITAAVCERALAQHLATGSALTLSVRQRAIRPYHPSIVDKSHFVSGKTSDVWEEVRGFILLQTQALLRVPDKMVPTAFVLDDQITEIRCFSDWWVCEGYLRRKRVLLRVIGDRTVGSGHVSRALALAHGINDHDIVFMCGPEDDVVINRVNQAEYDLQIVESGDEVARVLALAPDLVINDVLDSDIGYMKALSDAGVPTLNFEDLGAGGATADLVVNELYDTPCLAGDHYRWGASYVFLRDEFCIATPNPFSGKVQRILITFGGTDPADLTRLAVAAVVPYCVSHGIAVDIVVGQSYAGMETLTEYLRTETPADVCLHVATDAISRLMEGCQLAICSNGRTVYELAHMNVPAIVISQHAREETHEFSSRENGFVNLGCAAESGTTEANLATAFEELVTDPDARLTLWQATCRHDFVASKETVLSLIRQLLATGGSGTA